MLWGNWWESRPRVNTRAASAGVADEFFSSGKTRGLEYKTQPHLNYARCGCCGGSHTEIGIVDVHVRGAGTWIRDKIGWISYRKGWMIGRIEHLHAKLQIFRLGNRNIFHDAEVPVEKCRAVKRIAWQVPHRARLRIAKASGNQRNTGQGVVGYTAAIRTDKLRIDEQYLAIRLKGAELAGYLLWRGRRVRSIAWQRPG